MTDSAAAERIPAGTLVAAAGREVAALGAVAETLQGLVARHASDAQAVEEAQGLDFLLQHLTELGGLLQRLGAEPALAGPVDVAPLRAAATLADLAARLFGDPDAKPFARPAAGAVELF